jgi:hypothetical protein
MVYRTLPNFLCLYSYDTDAGCKIQEAADGISDVGGFGKISVHVCSLKTTKSKDI